uniref:C3H1-type domain-containing protein n=1 Tax=Paramormyrops kingsleyae TaxID=1676925 RepID=A0A3B3QG17_9TELE
MFLVKHSFTHTHTHRIKHSITQKQPVKVHKSSQECICVYKAVCMCPWGPLCPYIHIQCLLSRSRKLEAQSHDCEETNQSAALAFLKGLLTATS